MTARILFLDDDRERHRSYRSVHPEGHRAVCAASYEEAVELLKNHPFDLLQLDHDLCWEDSNCDPAKPTYKKTGSDLARWIATSKSPNDFQAIRLHSLNRKGVANMARILGQAGFIVEAETFLEMVARLRGTPLPILSGLGSRYAPSGPVVWPTPISPDAASETRADVEGD